MSRQEKMDQDITIAGMVFSKSEIDAEKGRLDDWPELFMESRSDLPMVDFRLIEPKLLIQGEITSHSMEMRRAFGLQLLAATELVQEDFKRFNGEKLECTLDLRFIASFFETLIARVIQILALWAFQNGIQLMFRCQLYPEPELDQEKIQSYVDSSWKEYKTTANHYPERKDLVGVEEIPFIQPR